jgi:hypothetical protein
MPTPATVGRRRDMRAEAGFVEGGLSGGLVDLCLVRVLDDHERGLSLRRSINHL